MKSTNASLLLTEPQAAAALAISPRKLWSLRQEGQIAYLKTGRLIRYDRKDVENWIKRNKRLVEPSLN